MASKTKAPAGPATAIVHAPENGNDKLLCVSCGTANAPDANFCKQCGHKILRATQQFKEEDFAEMTTPEFRMRDLLQWAFHKEEEGDLDAALAICADALKIEPESTSAHSLMGLLYEKKGEREKAIAEFEHVLLLNPGSIADREKLEQLRDSTTVITPRKITTVRKMPRALSLDSATGAIVASIAVFLIVLLVGAWAVFARSNHQGNKPPVVTSNRPAPAPILPAVPSSQNDAAVNTPQNNSANSANQSPPPRPAAQPNPNLQMNSQALNDSRPMERPRLPAGTEVPPVRVNIPQTQPMEAVARPISRPQNPANTLHLPDTSQPTAAPQQSPAATQTTGQAPARNLGKIEIVVSDSKTGSVVSSGNGTGPMFSTIDSRSRRTQGQQYQLQGNYRAAVKEYLRALDGAGDDAALIHQQIGQCYQRLDERESAIAHYNDAIAEYKRLISLGKNMDAAKSGIRFCESGIKACQ